MGKPLSRPDCLRQNPICLGKGEEEDGYIEDCYVPQRSIYDTMRINEQIDQGSKLNQTSKSTMEKIEGSSISSNGTLGAAANVFESRAPEGKKLDERIIFDALKLSSDVQKSAPVPPRRRPNAERKDNVNRRSWKSFMPPNFPEFAERMEASLSEVSEAGASNPCLQEKKESSSALTESSGHLDHREPQSESVTLEHVSKSIGIPEGQDVKNLDGDCQDFRFQQHSEISPREFQPLESEAAAASGNTDVTQEHIFSSATWPRAMKSLAKGGFGEKQHPLQDTGCTVEMPPLSPCLSEELLDPELHILITPSLREKTESELKFEEDERWIMMEAEEEWEEEKLSERGKTFLMADEEKNSLADVFKEREQANTVAVVEEGADCSAAVLGTFDPLALGQICCSDDPQPAKNLLASVLKDASLDYSCVLTGESAVGELRNRTAQGLEGLVSDLECTVGPASSEQLSDTDSVQMFLELEKECLCEEGVTPLVELETQASSEGLAPSQDAENSLVISHFPGAALEKEHLGLLNVRAKDSDPGLDCDYFNALDSSQVPNTLQLTAYSDTVRDASTVSEEEGEKVPFSPETAGEFNFRHPADLESPGKPDPGGLSNSDHRASHEENVSGFEAKLAKENGSLSQLDCSEVEGDAEECVERVPLSSAVSCELIDVTSGSEVEALLYDSHLLTDEIHWEGEKGAINQGNNSLTSLGDVDLCELLSVEGACDEDGEAQALGYDASLEDRAPAHLPRDLPEWVSQDLQRKSPESEILSLHLQVGGLGHSRDGVEAVNDIKPKLNVASLEGGETEMRDSDALLNILLEEQVTKASDTEPILEEWIPIPQKPDPTAAVPTVEEDALDAAVPAPEGTAVAALTVPFPEEDVPVVPVATMEAHVPAAAVSATERAAAPAAAVPPPEGTAPPAPVAITEEDVLAVAESSLEGTAPAAAVSTREEPVAPTTAVPTPEEPVAPTTAVPTPEEPAAPAAAVPTREEPAAPTAAVPTPEEPCPPQRSLLPQLLQCPPQGNFQLPLLWCPPQRSLPPQLLQCPLERSLHLPLLWCPPQRSLQPQLLQCPPQGSLQPQLLQCPPQGSLQPQLLQCPPQGSLQPQLLQCPPQGSLQPQLLQCPPQGSLQPQLLQCPPQGSLQPQLLQCPPQGSLQPQLLQCPPEGSLQPQLLQCPPQGSLQPQLLQCPPQGSLPPQLLQCPPQGSLQPQLLQCPPQGSLPPQLLRCPPQGRLSPQLLQCPPQGSLQPQLLRCPPQGSLQPQLLQCPPQGSLSPQLLQCPPQGSLSPQLLQCPPQGSLSPQLLQCPPQGSLSPQLLQCPPQGSLSPQLLQCPPQGRLPPQLLQCPPQGSLPPPLLQCPPQGSLPPLLLQCPPQGSLLPPLLQCPPQGSLPPRLLQCLLWRKCSLLAYPSREILPILTQCLS
ncbi:hypothetical protein J1605_012134 [Eschrichtius robustus]|uniref:Uncharacterized protein n=1 Tax=Eschrichtius robustus TaxID=9764 RepID=A0AB34GKC3_ESCRO|nr:hypothetical protein J1605_012134 [Eschrichtius robustus]